jgi:geranylgeranyl transferase type-2 subunit beta
MLFLTPLRDAFRTGLARADAGYRAKHSRWLTAQQKPDGGFANRRGNADVYYTAFALRGLTALAELTPETARAAGSFLRAQLDQPEDVRVKQPGGAFADAAMASSWWESLALCEEQTGPLLSPAQKASAAATTANRLAALRRADGGWAKTDTDGAGSLYHTLLAVCCWMQTGQSIPDADAARAFLRALAQPDGGFLENRYSKRPGLNGCAAGVGLSMLLGETADMQRHGALLLTMQDESGGFRAAPAAPMADLLSTYSALFALRVLDRVSPETAVGAARYARSLEQPGGGYAGFALDATADCEYTFYGLGVESLAGA